MSETDLATALLNNSAWVFIQLKEIAFHAQQPAQATAITKAISAGW